MSGSDESASQSPSPAMTEYSRLLNANLLIHFEAADQLERIQTLCRHRPLLKGHFSERLLIYDHIVTPTVDFSIVPVMVSWMGQELFREALTSGVLSFIRFRGALGYRGAGLGLCLYSMGKGDSSNWQPWHEAPFTDDAEMAVSVWLDRVLPEIGKKKRSRIARSVVKRTVLLDSPPEFGRAVAHETYMDALKSPFLQLYFGIRSTHLTHLTPVEPNQLRMFSPQKWANQEEFDEVDTLLGMAAVNLELSLAAPANATDVVFDPIIERFVRGKAERTLGSERKAEAFAQILTLNEMPNIAQVVADGHLTAQEIWKLRSSAKAEIFRRWFHERVAADPKRAAAEYVRALSVDSRLNNIPLKAFRLLVTSLVPGIGSFLASAADSVIFDATAHGRNPRYLIDEMQRVIPRTTDSQP